jgi:hypothetical protein
MTKSQQKAVFLSQKSSQAHMNTWVSILSDLHLFEGKRSEAPRSKL